MQTFTPKATKSDSGIAGSLAAKYGFSGGVTAEATLNTTGVLSTTIESSGLAKGLVVTLIKLSNTDGGDLFHPRCHTGRLVALADI